MYQTPSCEVTHRCNATTPCYFSSTLLDLVNSCTCHIMSLLPTGGMCVISTPPAGIRRCEGSRKRYDTHDECGHASNNTVAPAHLEFSEVPEAYHCCRALFLVEHSITCKHIDDPLKEPRFIGFGLRKDDDGSKNF